MKADQKAFSKHKYSRLVFGLISAILFILILSRSNIAIQYMNKGLKLCSQTVIPSLFPFMVISELIISSGLGRRIGLLFSKPSRWLFGISEGGSCSFILGAICGFPIGARTALSLYKKGDISKSEFSRLLTFCNNPGSAFVISAVGSSLFGDKRTGTVLYICVILSSVTVGILGKIIFGNTARKSSHILSNDNEDHGISMFTRAVQNSALSMLTVCAYVTFFSSVIGCIGAMTDSWGVPSYFKSALFGFFEISSGISATADIGDPMTAILLCSWVLGWSGVSVHCQIISICSGHEVSFAPYILAKAVQGSLCAIFSWLAFRFVLPSIGKDTLVPSAVLSEQTGYSNAAFLCCVFFIATILPIILNSFISKNKSMNSCSEKK